MNTQHNLNVECVEKLEFQYESLSLSVFLG